jgi:hypothetical protein
MEDGRVLGESGQREGNQPGSAAGEPEAGQNPPASGAMFENRE